MADYRQWHVVGTFFFTVATHSRAPLFRDAAARQILGEKFRDCLRRVRSGGEFFQVPNQ